MALVLVSGPAFALDAMSASSRKKEGRALRLLGGDVSTQIRLNRSPAERG